MKYLDVLDEVAKVLHLNSVSISEESRMHSGLLGLDILLGRGIGPTLFTAYGPEQSAKTTMMLTIMGATINEDVDLAAMWDAEGSTGSSGEYASSVLRGQGINTKLENIFGVKKKDVWVIPPLVYYQDEGTGEDFFNWLHGVLKRMPAKRHRNGKWWLVYPNTKPNISKWGPKSNKEMSRENEGIWVEAKDGKLQAVILVDSWVALVPDAQDNEEHTEAIAVQARMFSKHLMRVKGYVRSRRVALLGTNQLRLAPMGFGNPEREPGGEALKFFSDQRLRLYPRALSQVPFHPKGGKASESNIETEPSISGEGVDKYRYVHGRTVKNKLGTPNQEMWFRLWVEDENGMGRGYDLVWDTFYAMYLCGMVMGKRSSMKLNVPGLGETTRNLNWIQFKALILGDKEIRAKICKAIGWKTVDLRKGLIGLSRKGVLDDMYWANKKAMATGAKVKSTGDASDDDEDDEDAK